MKNPRNKQRKKYDARPKETETQIVSEITPEIIQDIDDMLTEAMIKAKEKYPQAAEPIDKLLNSLGVAMADIIINNASVETKKENIDEESSIAEPVLPDYDKAIDKMRDQVKRKKKYYEEDEEESGDIDIILDEDDEDSDSPVYEDKDDDEDDDYLPRLRSIGNLNYESSATSYWYEVFYTLDKSGTEASVKVRANSEEEAESKVIMMVTEECTIENIIEIEDDDTDEDIPVIINSEEEDDEYDVTDPNYSVMGSVYKHMRKDSYRR